MNYFHARTALPALSSVLISLTGCSALQIDVDVYKGALLNEEEVQRRQYANMALASLPFINRLKGEIDATIAKCQGDSNKGQVDPCENLETLEGARQFITRTLIYFDTVELPTTAEAKSSDFRSSAQRTQKGTKVLGILDLTKALADAYAMPNAKADEQLTRSAEIEKTSAALDELLLVFSQSILEYVNNEALFYRSGNGRDIELLKTTRSSLQSLANTLLVHANDLQRRAKRDADQKRRRTAETQAIEAAFRKPPAQAFDEMLADLTRLSETPRTSSAGIDPSKDPLADKKVLLTQRQDARRQQADELTKYEEGLAGVSAAYETLVDTAQKVMHAHAPTVSQTERLAAARDRKAVAALYPNLPVDENDKTEAGAFSPLLKWLDRERMVGWSLERQRRLTLVVEHVKANNGRMLGMLPVLKSDLLTAMRMSVADDLTLARQQITDLNNRLKTLDGEIKKLTNELKTDGQALALIEKLKTEAAAAERIRSVMTTLRSEILSQADAAKVTDRDGVRALLQTRLVVLKNSPPPGGPKVEDIALVLDRVVAYKPAAGIGCGKDSKDRDSCGGETQMDVIDAQIASLRAQRVQALASGNKLAAENLLAAINAAYEQRTAMIYLRPASDYLRSVHSASDLQDASQAQFRNMLNDWANYLRPGLLTKEEPDFQRRAELEKLYWQNINRVTLDGGGKGNYVIAKDDVGNWYVKAYSSDPKVIFESATKLALFNTGARVNLNLMQRYDTQSRIDASRDDEEKKRLKGELDNLNSQDGKPLLALRDRYARQYKESTKLGALRLKDQLSNIGSAVDGLIAGATGAGSCAINDLKSGLPALDKQYLDSPRTRLDALLAIPATADLEALPEGLEKAIQSGITGLHLYSSKVYQTIDESKAQECVTEWRRQLALDARKLVRAQVLDLASERRNDIERYEGALANITEVAIQR